MKFAALLSLFVSLSSFGATVLICKTPAKVDGWKGTSTHDYVHLTAYVSDDEHLVRAVVSGAYASGTEDVAASPGYKPASPLYRTYNRFASLEDAWNYFRPLLPKKLVSLRAPFTGYLQVVGEESYKGTLKLNCFLRRR